jgi:hypothetical protein
VRACVHACVRACLREDSSALNRGDPLNLARTPATTWSTSCGRCPRTSRWGRGADGAGGWGGGGRPSFLPPIMNRPHPPIHPPTLRLPSLSALPLTQTPCSFAGLACSQRLRRFERGQSAFLYPTSPAVPPCSFSGLAVALAVHVVAAHLGRHVGRAAGHGVRLRGDQVGPCAAPCGGRHVRVLAAGHTGVARTRRHARCGRLRGSQGRPCGAPISEP